MTEDQEKPEWKEMSPDAPIRQGDLLAVRNRKTLIVEKMAVVITADCDIDKNKFGSQIACLNIQFHQTYIRTTWAERALVAAKKKALAPVADKLRSLHSQQIGEQSTLSTDAIEAWLMRDDLEAIAGELNVAPGDMKALAGHVSPCQKALRALQASRENAPFEQLNMFTSALKGQSVDETRTSLLKSAQGTTLPEDVFLIPGFPGAPSKPIAILLREVIGIPSDHVKTRQSEALDPSYYLRVGRLRSTFKFALSQSFGSLYSKIGLPRAYELRRNNALNGTLSYEWK
jgi:hypothetical protein